MKRRWGELLLGYLLLIGVMILAGLAVLGALNLGRALVGLFPT